MNRSQICIDSDNIDYFNAGPIQGSVIVTKNGNAFEVVEDPETVRKMYEENHA